jgi:hypothetical protein
MQKIAKTPFENVKAFHRDIKRSNMNLKLESKR